MVSQNVVTRKKVRQRRSAAQEQQAQALMAACQNTLNMVLWQIIDEHAPVAEDAETKEAGGILTVPMADIGLVPKTFALSIDPDPENGVIRIHATVQKEKSNIILPDGGSLGSIND
ncbi:MAG TPA: hypothetical protein ENH62_03545 [Marinobacter sp.]|nr:hypothetical protein [Marinobacter sp.]